MIRQWLGLVAVLAATPCWAFTSVDFTGSGKVTYSSERLRNNSPAGTKVLISGTFKLPYDLADDFTGELFLDSTFAKQDGVFSWRGVAVDTGQGVISEYSFSGAAIQEIYANFNRGRLNAISIYAWNDPDVTGIYAGPPGSAIGRFYYYDRGNSLRGVWSLNRVTAVPEPMTWVLLTLGFAGVGLRSRRRQRSSLVA